MNEIRVVKLGGSLLDWSETPERLASWLQDQSPARTVIIVGGGELVEALRRLDRVLQLDQDDIHFAAIDLMTITAKLFHSKFPSWNLCTEESLSRSLFRSEASILDVAKWARSKTGLQKNWSVSSDSIAAAVAEEINADELVLLKSTLPGTGESLEDILASDYLDTDFINWATRLKSLRFVDLRSPSCSELRFDSPLQTVSALDAA